MFKSTNDGDQPVRVVRFFSRCDMIEDSIASLCSASISFLVVDANTESVICRLIPFRVPAFVDTF
jgi:hypothetical protein